MEQYIVSARKYRPSTFNTVIGQKPLTAALKHAVATDRLAHAYLFCGSRGVGKTSCARIFAKTINCEHRTADGEACNECPSCRAFNNSTSLNIIELDAASHNGIDDMKSLIEQVLMPPTQGRFRVFIIDEVHMLTTAAFNAFLKTLEEPPEYVIFILATTEKHKIIPTILSRCQIYDFSRITIQDMVDHLTYVAQSENIAVEASALNVIARKADGAMRDALSIFDQVAASTMGNVTYANTIANLNILDNTYYTRLLEAFLTGDVPTSLLIYQEVRDKGFDSQFFINGLAQYMRDIMVAFQPQTLKLLEATDDVRAEMATMAKKCTPQWIYRAMDLCNTADLNYKAATSKQFLIELTLIKLCQINAPATAPAAAPLKPVQPAAPQASPTVQPQTATPVQTQAAPSAQPQQPVASFTPPAQPQRQTSSTYTPPIPQRPAGAPAIKRGSLPSFSIQGQSQKSSAKEEDSEADDISHRRSEPYTYPQLTEAWNEFINQHPTERILVNTLKASLPEQVEGDSYRIVVYDNIQVETVNEAKTRILTYLHDRLKNDNIDITVSIHQGEASPMTWTQRQVLQHMYDKSVPLRSLIEDFGLTI